MNFAVLVVILAAAQVNSHPHPSVKIINGKEATPHSFPSAVKIDVLTRDGRIWNSCEGSLISANFVLTDATCAEDLFENEKTGTVTLGAHNASAVEETQVKIGIKSAVLHPQYDYLLRANDIALVELESSVEFNDVIQPIALPEASAVSNDHVGETAKVWGWGTVCFDCGYKGYMDVLRTYENEVVMQAECGENAPPKFVHESTLCLSDGKDHRTSFSDYGSGLIIDEVLVAISIEAVAEDGPAIFTRVDNYLDWINENSDVKTTV